MAQPDTPASLMLSIKGLYLNPSTFGSDAQGALTIANNVVIDRPSVVATRRGFSNAFSTLDSTGSNSLFQYANTLLAHGTDDKMYVDVLGNGTFTPYVGTYDVPIPSSASSRVRGLETNKNFYFITSNGTYRIDTPPGTPRLAGSPPGLSGEGVILGTTGFLPTNTLVAYRVVFGYRDFNQQLVLGAPSSRIVIANTSANSTNVTLTFQVPKEIQASPANFFFQVYRGNASPNLTTDPDDEMSLTYEDVCSGTPTITINDITPSALLGAALYTNQGQDGILQSNYRPPWAADVCTFKQYAFYANTRTIHNANATIISAGAANGPDAMVTGDTITFTATEPGGPTFTLTAAAANDFITGEFAVSNTGSPGFDIQTTASNLCLVANAFAGNTFLAAYYVSEAFELPGKMRFDRLTLTEANFTITSTNSGCWEQALPIKSINDTRPNRIYYSKFNQPEAVPVVNYIEVGSANAPINRIIPLRDGVMVLKQDGVFRISNAAPPFTITAVDYNIRILADNSAAELNNLVYFLSDQGVVALSDSDAEVKSFVLDKTIIENTSPTLFPNLQATVWGQAYQSDRKYILAMPTTAIDTQATQQYVFNHFTNVWTRWTIPSSCAIVFRKTGKLYLGSLGGSAPGVNNSYLYEERKSFTTADYADSQFTMVNSTVGNTNIIVIDNPTLPLTTTIEVGDTILQSSSSSQARILQKSVGLAQTTLVLDKNRTWKAGALLLFKPIKCEVQTIQLDCQNPGMNKQFSEMVYIFTEQSFSQLLVRISTNTTSTPANDILIPLTQGGWGIDPWGTTPWGGSPSGQGKIRRYVPQAVQRAGWLYLNISNAEAFSAFGWSGVELFFNSTSSRERKK